jgi:hypothetical protein
MEEKSFRSAVQLSSADRDPMLRMRPVRSTRANSANTPPKMDRWSGSESTGDDLVDASVEEPRQQDEGVFR